MDRGSWDCIVRGLSPDSVVGSVSYHAQWLSGQIKQEGSGDVI